MSPPNKLFIVPKYGTLHSYNDYQDDFLKGNLRNNETGGVGMCGYCIEGLIVWNYMETDLSWAIKDIGDTWSTYEIVFFQECKDFIGLIDQIKEFDDRNSMDVVFCRLYEQYIINGHDKLIYDAIKSAYSQETIQKFFDDRNTCLENGFGFNLGNQDIYEDKQCWNDQILNIPNCIAQSKKILESYYDWWILGNNKESDPSKSGFGRTTSTDWDKFDLLFPTVFVSLLILFKYHPKSDIIRRIALRNPHGVPLFDGFDLWLQRKAFECFVRENGIRYIVNKLSRIRPELIRYVLLKNCIATDELKSLKKLISSKIYQFEYDVVRDAVSELIDQTLTQMTSSSNRWF